MIMLIIAGAFAGGFANGLAGFGTGLFALGWWLAAMPPLDAVITVVIMSLVGGVQGLYAVRNAIDFREQLRFLVPALIGVLLTVAPRCSNFLPNSLGFRSFGLF